MVPTEMTSAIPASLDDSSQKKLDKLRNAKPDDFASDYDPMQLSAHKDAVSLFECYAKGGDNAKLRDWAGKTFPHCNTICRWRNSWPRTARIEPRKPSRASALGQQTWPRKKSRSAYSERLGSRSLGISHRHHGFRRHVSVCSFDHRVSRKTRSLLDLGPLLLAAEGCEGLKARCMLPDEFDIDNARIAIGLGVIIRLNHAFAYTKDRRRPGPGDTAN
jgi:hypothetical protein